MTMRWSEEALAAFEKRSQEWRAKGTVRTHVIKDELPTGQKKVKAVYNPYGSTLERRIMEQIKFLKLPEPTREYQAIPGRRFRLDLAWPDRKIGLEVQGMVHRIKERFKNDIEKRALHLLDGWRVLEVSGREIRSGVAIEWLKRLLA